MEHASLPRRAFLGVVLAAPRPDDHGLPVERVVACSMAERIAVQQGDVVEAADGVPFAVGAGLGARLAVLGTMERTTLRVRRGSTVFERRVAVTTLPHETLPGHEVRYGHVAVPGEGGDAVRLRTILTLPRSPGPHPALLLVQGIGCASVDFWWTPEAPLCRLVHGLAAEGFVTLRVEKRGVGDSEGGPCESVGFHDELSGYGAALGWLMQQPEVDVRRVSLVGHSVGGMMAPLLAGGRHTMVVIGTSAEPWSRCILRSIDRQHALRGMPPAERAIQLELARAMLAHAIDAGRTPAEAVRLEPRLAELLARDPPSYGPGLIFGRAPHFFRELEAADLAGAFASAAARVLVVHGEHDWVVGEDEARAIVERVRAAGGDASFDLRRGMDHQMTLHVSRDESVRRHGQGAFDERLPADIARFLQGREPARGHG